MSILWTIAALVVLTMTAVLTTLAIGLMRAVSRLEYRTRSLASRCESVLDDERLAVARRALRGF